MSPASSLASDRDAIIDVDVDAALDGYVVDNMEGAVDQAAFLARVDLPVAVIGARGTGKMYLARVVHSESGGSPDAIVAVDCREFRNKLDAITSIARELEAAEGKTLVFKSPHLMHADAQLKLARQISSRTFVDAGPQRYLPRARFVGLFPDTLEHLSAEYGLHEKLASVFAGYPIYVPPMRERKRAVLRWANKILSQEAETRDRQILGFSPDAEAAMLAHEWRGNITEIRQRVLGALDRSTGEWLTAVDLGLFFDESDAAGGMALEESFLELMDKGVPDATPYNPTAIDELDQALGMAVHDSLASTRYPLGDWLDDELLLAVLARYRQDVRKAADFLQTSTRNINRWLPKIASRTEERRHVAWREPARLVAEWVREASVPESPPQEYLRARLLAHIEQQGAETNIKVRSQIMAVSIPTYQKRLKTLLSESEGAHPAEDTSRAR
jgi:DNA-binding NtrC family response regulator